MLKMRINKTKRLFGLALVFILLFSGQICLAENSILAEKAINLTEQEYGRAQNEYDAYLETMYWPSSPEYSECFTSCAIKGGLECAFSKSIWDFIKCSPRIAFCEAKCLAETSSSTPVTGQAENVNVADDEKGPSNLLNQE